MKLILFGLALAIAPAHASLLNPAYREPLNQITFETEMASVTDFNTPDFLRLTDLLASWELSMGTTYNINGAFTVVLRRLLQANQNGSYTGAQWMDVPAMIFQNRIVDLAGNTPEPATLLLTAAALGALIMRLKRESSAKPLTAFVEIQ